MPTLTVERLRETTIPLSTGCLLAACSEAKGKQDLRMRQKPEVLEAVVRIGNESMRRQYRTESGRLLSLRRVPDRYLKKAVRNGFEESQWVASGQVAFSCKFR